MIQAIIFDFDGLIFDSETPDYESWRQTYADYGVTLPLDLWVANIGSTDFFDPYAYLEAQVKRPLDRSAVRRVRRQRDDALLAAQTIMPGVREVVSAAQQLGLRLGVASSSPHSWVDDHLARLGLLPAFETICCRDDVGGRSKPHPAVYSLAVRRLGVTPQQALALEDSPNGVTAAKEAGLWCTAVPNQMTRTLNFDHADYRLETLSALPLPDLIDEVLRARQK